jgi:subtilase family serine protease
MGYTPSQIRHAYGFDQITLAGGVAGDGSGTTIAIVDAFDDPNIANDLQQFDAQFGLPNPGFTKVNQSGGTLLPSVDSGWASEIALDVEWSHAIAPAAKILLIEAADNTYANMFAAVTYAARQPGVVAVSMSWAGEEDSTETSYDKNFLTPSGHSGVTFVASSGDSGAPPSYPAISPNVLATGGTTLNLNSQGNYLSESGWSGSGGGISTVEAQPAYQQGVVTQSSSFRTNPDVAYDADPNTGFPVYDSFNNGAVAPWSEFGGTSAAAPQWAALVALADQGRILAGKSALDGPSQTLPMLYQLPATDFHDISSGSSQGSPHYSAAPGYDLVTGRGTPIANKIVADLIGNAPSTGLHFSVSAPAGSTAGSAFSITVTALDSNNNTLTSYTGTVHFTSSDITATLPANYTFTTADKGVHTFTNGVTLTKAGSDTVTVNDTTATLSTGSAIVTVTAANPNHLGFSQQPTNTVAGNPISPAVTVQLLDLYNNLVSSNNTATVSIALASNPGSSPLSGTTNATVTGGIATFSNLSINKTGNGYNLQASSSNLSSASSAGFNITPGKASKLAFSQQPSTTPAGTVITPAVTVQVLDANGNIVTTDKSDPVTIGLSANPGSGSLSGTLTVTAQSGVATFSNLAISKPGTAYTLAASSGSLVGASSAAFNVSPASSTTAIVCSANPSVSGQSVTFTATVSGAGTPTGVVTFSDGMTSIGRGTLTTSGGTTTASFSISSLAVGSHTITASYAGDSTFLASTGTLVQTVNKGSTSTSVVVSVNPSVSGQMITLTTTVMINSPGSPAVATPTGVVTLSDGAMRIGQGMLTTSGGVTTASFSLFSLAVGSHTLAASYAGDSNFQGSAATLTQTVKKASTNTAVVSSVGAPVFGQSVTFTVTVTVSSPGSTIVASPAGTVTFSDGATSIGQGTLTTIGGVSTASFSTASLTVGGHTITASYAGDNNFLSSMGSVSQSVSKASTSVLVTASANPSVYGQSLIFTATIAVQGPGSGTPTGTVQFQIDGSNSNGAVSVGSAGGPIVASFSTKSLVAGIHTISASYSGDGSFVGSAVSLVQMVGQAGTITAVATSVPSSVSGQSVIFTATVGVQSPGSSALANPSGTVTFYDGNQIVDQATVSAGVDGATTASISIASLAVGAHTISAGYGGDANFAPSNGTLPGSQVVNQASTNTAVVSSLNPSVFAQSVMFTATISIAAPGAGTPSGTVQFQIDGTNFGSAVPVSGGVAVSPPVGSLSVTSHTVQAVYSGDANFIPSTGTLTQIINPGSANVVSVSGFPLLSTAGASASFIVTLQDLYGNTATGYSGTVHFSSSDSLASLPADYPFTAADNGVHTFSAAFKTAGNQSLTVTDTLNGSLTGSQSGIVISPAAPDHLLVTPSVATSVAGTPFDVTVTVQDVFDNTVTGYTGTVTFSSVDPYGASLPAGYTFTAADDGVHTFPAGVTLYTTGSWNVTATDAATGITGGANVTVTPAAAVQFRVAGPVTIASNTPFDVTVTALDPYANVASNYQGTISFSTTDPDPGVLLPANYTFSVADAGMHSFASGVILVTAGSQNIGVTDTNGLTGSDTITVTVPPPPSGGGDGGAAGRREPGWPFAEALTSSCSGVISILEGEAKWRDPNWRGLFLTECPGSRETEPGCTWPAARVRSFPAIEQVLDAFFATDDDPFSPVLAITPSCPL